MYVLILTIDLLAISGGVALAMGRFAAIGMGSDDPDIRRQQDDEQMRYLALYRARQARKSARRRERLKKWRDRLHR